MDAGDFFRTLILTTETIKTATNSASKHESINLKKLIFASTNEKDKLFID